MDEFTQLPAVDKLDKQTNCSASAMDFGGLHDFETLVQYQNKTGGQRVEYSELVGHRCTKREEAIPSRQEQQAKK